MEVCPKQVFIKVKEPKSFKKEEKQKYVLSTAAEIAEQPRTTGEETGKETPANGKSERSSNSQSGAGKKVRELKTYFTVENQRRNPGRLP